MTIDTRQRGVLASLRRRVSRLHTGGSLATELVVRALEGFLIAAEYKDVTLMQSHLAAARMAINDYIAKSIEEMLNVSADVRSDFQEAINLLEGSPIVPDSDFDDTGRDVSDIVQDELSTLTTFRDGALAMFKRYGVEADNEAMLHEEISRWQSIKENIVDCWPWTNAPLPPVDRQMVAESRLAHQRGERAENIDDLIERLKSKQGSR